jgi:hypothetical protein
MRLFIAIVLQSFQETSEKDNKFMNSELSDHFREVWSKFDPDVSYNPPYHDFGIGHKFYQG